MPTLSIKATPSAESEHTTLLLFGAGGHGCVVADAAQQQGRWLQIHASDRDPARCQGELLPGIALKELASAQFMRAGLHVSIGGNVARELEAKQWGIDRLVSVCHPSASVSFHARLEAGSFIASHAVIAPRAYVGVGAIVNHGAVLDHDAVAGAFSHVAPGAVVGGGARIGSRVLLGAGAVLLPGVTVADDAVIGAGSVVTQSLVQAGIYAGVPARRIR